MTIITHTREAGTLIKGTTKGDGSNIILKAAGWRWSRNLGTWYVPHTRDRAARWHLINDTAEQLREAGFAVEIEINDAARPTAAVEHDKAQRAGGGGPKPWPPVRSAGNRQQNTRSSWRRWPTPAFPREGNRSRSAIIPRVGTATR